MEKGHDKKLVRKVIKYMGLHRIENVIIQNSKSADALTLEDRKKVQIALEILKDPVVICLDEPFEGLNMNSIRSILQILKRFTDIGKLVVITLNDVKNHEMLEFFDQIIIMHDGKKVFDGTYNEIRPYFKSKDIKIPPLCNAVNFITGLLRAEKEDFEKINQSKTEYIQKHYNIKTYETLKNLTNDPNHALLPNSLDITNITGFTTPKINMKGNKNLRCQTQIDIKKTTEINIMNDMEKYKLRSLDENKDFFENHNFVEKPKSGGTSTSFVLDENPFANFNSYSSHNNINKDIDNIADPVKKWETINVKKVIRPVTLNSRSNISYNGTGVKARLLENQAVKIGTFEPKFNFFYLHQRSWKNMLRNYHLVLQKIFKILLLVIFLAIIKTK